MGIRNLNNFIKKVCPECITENNIDKYYGKIFAIDCSILLYKYRYISSKLDNSHIIGFLNRVIYYRNHDILPVFVFDGKPPDEKKNTLIKRNSNKKKIEDKIEILQDTITDDKTMIEKIEINNVIDKLSKQVIYINKQHINECKELLNLMGIPYISAPDEAEKYCAYLQINNYVDYTISDDTDTLTFGCENVIKTTVKDKLIETNLEILKNKLGYSSEKFIDFCILSGCDYSPFIPKLAINTVYTLFKKYSTIEEIKSNTNYVFPEDVDYKKIRSLFTDFEYEKINNFELKDIDYNQLKNFLENKNINNIEKIFNKILI